MTTYMHSTKYNNNIFKKKKKSLVLAQVNSILSYLIQIIKLKMKLKEKN